MRATVWRKLPAKFRPDTSLWLSTVLLAGVLGGSASASTYVAYIPLDSSIYVELDTLNGLGCLDTYLNEIRPISRVEAARLTLEAEQELEGSGKPDRLAASLVRTLREQLAQEVEWLENDMEDNLPTMVRPLERAQAQYIFTQGEHRLWQTSAASGPPMSGLYAAEAAPLMPNNDGIPTASGSNEIFRWAGWAGLGGFMTAYGEGAVSGPFTRAINIDHGDRMRPLGTAVVASLGNFALSLGDEEMSWGVGYFAKLSQGNNAIPFPALRIQNVHPTLLPGFLRYLGQFRYQAFFGQLDDNRYFAHPWIDGQIFSFKPLPTFEIGFTHTIVFGGRYNDNYSFSGFIGRATGFETGNPTSGNTNSRGGIYLKLYFPSMRNLQVYQEILGEDNLTKEVTGIGRFLPFLAVSYQGGLYLPRLTADGLTDLRFEYAILEPNYSIHSDSLYWTYDNRLMADGLGPNASEVDLAVSRWLGDLNLWNLALDAFFTVRAPGWGQAPNTYPASIYGTNLTKERAEGVAFNLMRMDAPVHRYGDGLLAGLAAQIVVENVHALNYNSANNSIRLLISFTASLSSDFTLKWR
jgi:hypothetical protein